MDESLRARVPNSHDDIEALVIQVPAEQDDLTTSNESNVEISTSSSRLSRFFNFSLRNAANVTRRPVRESHEATSMPEGQEPPSFTDRPPSPSGSNHSAIMARLLEETAVLELERRKTDALVHQADAALRIAEADNQAVLLQLETRRLARLLAEDDFPSPSSAAHSSAGRRSRSPPLEAFRQEWEAAATAREAAAAEHRAARDAAQQAAAAAERLADQEERRAERAANDAQRRADWEGFRIQQESAAAMLAAVLGQKDRTHLPYTPGLVLKAKGISTFTGQLPADQDTIEGYFASLQATLAFGQVPPTAWARELQQYITGDAQIFMEQLSTETDGSYAERFSFAEIVAHLIARFAPRWEAPCILRQLLNPARLPGTSPREAAAASDQLIAKAALLGIPLSEELKWSGLLNSLGPLEQEAWFLIANVDTTINETALTATRNRTSEGGYRSSVGGATSTARSEVMAKRYAHLKAWMEQQGNPPSGRATTSRQVTSTARAAVVVSEVSPDPMDPLTQTVAASPGTTAPPAEPSDVECALRILRARRITADTQQRLDPPEFLGPNPQHKAENAKELLKRRACKACFGCPMSSVKYNVSFLDCPQHGKTATQKQRSQNRVKGSCIGTVQLQA